MVVRACVRACVQGAARAGALCDPVFDGMDNMLATLVQQVPLPRVAGTAGQRDGPLYPVKQMPGQAGTARSRSSRDGPL